MGEHVRFINAYPPLNPMHWTQRPYFILDVSPIALTFLIATVLVCGSLLLVL